MIKSSRSATRHQVAMAVTIVVPGESKEPLPPATIENISLGGAFVATGRRLTIGTQVVLTFRIPTHDQPIEAAAVVRWSTERGAGVQFEGLRAGEVWSLGKFFEGLESS